MSVENENPFKFRIAPLPAKPYHSWSYNMEIGLREKELWKFVKIKTVRP